jgi:hypothetical protein
MTSAKPLQCVARGGVIHSRMDALRDAATAAVVAGEGSRISPRDKTRAERCPGCAPGKPGRNDGSAAASPAPSGRCRAVAASSESRADRRGQFRATGLARDASSRNRSRSRPSRGSAEAAERKACQLIEQFEDGRTRPLALHPQVAAESGEGLGEGGAKCVTFPHYSRRTWRSPHFCTWAASASGWCAFRGGRHGSLGGLSFRVRRTDITL